MEFGVSNPDLKGDVPGLDKMKLCNKQWIPPVLTAKSLE